MTFDEGGAFLPKRAMGAIIVLGLWTILLLQRKQTELEKGLSGVMKKY
jgi:hypothetical protein